MEGDESVKVGYLPVMISVREPADNRLRNVETDRSLALFSAISLRIEAVCMSRAGQDLGVDRGIAYRRTNFAISCKFSILEAVRQVVHWAVCDRSVD